MPARKIGNSADAYVSVGEAWLNRNHFSLAQGLFQLALDQDSEHLLAHYDLGLVLHVRGLYLAAIEHYLRALEVDSNFAPAHYHLALAYQTVGERQKAANHFSFYLRKLPDRRIPIA